MMIKKLDATFGKLEGESLELHDGLNVISAPNESGKSTWCAFVRAMLYGVDSSERQKAGFLPDKMRFAPWSGSAMQGSMQLESGGRDITITRTTKTASAPMREFSAVYTGTSVPVEGLNGNNAGEMLTGVSRDVFRRSAFVEQGKVAVTHSAELEKRISAIVSSGDEDCSFTEADSRLRQWQRKRRFNRHFLADNRVRREGENALRHSTRKYGSYAVSRKRCICFYHGAQRQIRNLAVVWQVYVCNKISETQKRLNLYNAFFTRGLKLKFLLAGEHFAAFLHSVGKQLKPEVYGSEIKSPAFNGFGIVKIPCSGAELGKVSVARSRDISVFFK